MTSQPMSAIVGGQSPSPNSVYHRHMESPQSGLKFLHRIGKYRGLESVCMTCFSTVSHTWGDSSLTAEELTAVESAHICK